LIIIVTKSAEKESGSTTAVDTNVAKMVNITLEAYFIKAY